MKFTLSWLKEHLETEATLDEIVEAMTMAGLEVEDVEDPAARLAAFSTAKVISAEKHPDADKLKICTVETVDGMKQIVCGAPNARAGMIGIYAPLGAYIPGLDFSLDKKPRKIRGIESYGMLCSTKELEAGEDHDGIADLKDEWPVGTPAAEALGMADPVIDFEVTPNRPDWLGIEGIARDLAAAGLGKLKDRAPRTVSGAFPCPVKVAIRDTDFCPAFGLRLVRGVKNGPSPDWLQARLKAIGLRPINALVDITNFITYDRGRPLHVFDAAKVKGDLVIRRALAGETLKALDEREYALDEEVGVIADDAGVESLAGVMGGEETGCTDETTDVLIESALWDPIAIAKIGRKLGIMSDAQYRFARGVDTHFMKAGLELATEMVMELCGGEPSEVEIAGEIPTPPEAIRFNLSEPGRLTGLTLGEKREMEILTDLGCTIDGMGEETIVQPPTWRRDLTQDADLVEEIARIHGYDKLDATPLPRLEGNREPVLSEGAERARRARRALAADGWSEAVTWSFCRADQAALFDGEDAPRVANPISSELDTMRPTPLVHLILGLQKNADRGQGGVWLAEIGPAWKGAKPEDQMSIAAGALRADAARHWEGAQTPDIFTVKAAALTALQAAGAPVDNLQTDRDVAGWWHPGRSGAMKLGNRTLAVFGEIHPHVLNTLDIEGRVLAFECYLDQLPPVKKKDSKSKGALNKSDLNPLTRDFAFLVDAETPAEQVARAAKGADKKLISDARIFDLYEGKGVPEGQKSLAIEVTIQPRDATLSDKEIDKVSEAVVAAVKKATGAELRG